MSTLLSDWCRIERELGWLGDGSVLCTVWSGEETVGLSRLREPGQVEPLGTVPHAAGAIRVSSDPAQATLGWRDDRGDAWLYRVVKP